MFSSFGSVIELSLQFSIFEVAALTLATTVSAVTFATIAAAT
jgi:hypothetical protein